MVALTESQKAKIVSSKWIESMCEVLPEPYQGKLRPACAVLEEAEEEEEAE